MLEAWDLYYSIKMRLAEEIKQHRKKYFYGDGISFPDGVGARDIAIATVWYLSEMAQTRIEKFYGASRSDLKLSITMGIPMSFFSDTVLREGFLEVIRSAYWLLKHHDGKSIREGRLPLDQLQKLSELARNEVRKIPVPDANTVRDWLRTEAESALVWAFTSPNIKQGLYAKADVGAGTTNASLFRITERYNAATGQWQKDGFAFFGATSDAVGMDCIDEIMEKHGLQDFRGNEDSLLRKQPGLCKECEKYIDQMHEAVEEAWGIAFSKQRDVSQWKALDIFVIGGGSQVAQVRSKMTVHPYVNRHCLSAAEQVITIKELDKPSDLQTASGMPMMDKDLPFLLVAYGLSNNRLSIREVVTPSEIKTIPPPVRMERLFVPFEEL